ncbi:hypothetical protein [Luteibacter sp. CQ10]|uniref:hypothetical protein n=1 Tax=Luteibacter sp. CQ10 TaxID=2805821 RepID=UPI0034A34E5C
MPQPLAPPRIPGAPDGNIGIADVLYGPGIVVPVETGAIAGAAAGDILSLYIDDEALPVVETPIAVASSDWPCHVMPLPAGIFADREDGPFTMTYRWRSAGGEEATSEPGQFHLERTAPGSPGQPIGTWTNPDLRPARIEPNPVPDPGPDGQASVTVTIDPWTNAAAGDVVSLQWHRTVMRGQPLTKETAGRPIVFILGHDALLDMGLGSLQATWWVEDTNRNWSLKAPSVPVDVQIDAPGSLPKPELVGIAEGVLDITGMGDTSLVVRAPFYPGLAKDQQVTMHWVGTDAEGVVHRFDSEPLTVTWPVYDLPFTVDFDDLEVLEDGGTLAISYSVDPIDGVSTSAHARYTVTGVVELPAPLATDDANADDTLDFETEIPEFGATFVVPKEAKHAFGDVVTFHWDFSADGMEPVTKTATREVSKAMAGKDLPFELPWDDLSPFATGILRIHYTNLRFKDGEGAAPVASAVRELSLSGKLLVLPNVPQATGEGGTLLTHDDYYRMSSLSVEVPAYEGMAATDTVYVSWKGGYPKPYETDARAVGTVGPQTFTIPRSEVLDVIGGEATIRYYVRKSADGPWSLSEAFRLKVQAQPIALSAPTFERTPTGWTVTVTAPPLASGDAVSARVAGVADRDTSPQASMTGDTLDLLIPDAWLTENAGQAIYVNYSVVRPSLGTQYIFSKVTRFDVPAA